MSNTSFRFDTFLLSARSSQSLATSCSGLMSHHRVNNKCNRVKGQRWRWLIYALRRFLLHNNVMCFQKQPPLFLKVSQIPQENTCVWVSFFFKIMKLYKDICSARINRTSAETFLHRLTSQTSQNYNRSIVILRRALLWIFGKWFMKTSKKTFIS